MLRAGHVLDGLRSIAVDNHSLPPLASSATEIRVECGIVIGPYFDFQENRHVNHVKNFRFAFNAVRKVIARPEKFDGKPVRLIGFLRIEFEGDAVYLHREDFDHGIPQNGVWIDIPSDMTDRQKRDVNMRYVICPGVFSARNRGHMSMFSGAITNVRRLEFWSDEPPSTKALPPPKVSNRESVGETSPFRSSTRKKAKQKRKIVKSLISSVIMQPLSP